MGRRLDASTLLGLVLIDVMYTRAVVPAYSSLSCIPYRSDDDDPYASHNPMMGYCVHGVCRYTNCVYVGVTYRSAPSLPSPAFMDPTPIRPLLLLDYHPAPSLRASSPCDQSAAASHAILPRIVLIILLLRSLSRSAFCSLLFWTGSYATAACADSYTKQSDTFYTDCTGYLVRQPYP